MGRGGGKVAPIIPRSTRYISFHDIYSIFCFKPSSASSVRGPNIDEILAWESRRRRSGTLHEAQGSEVTQRKGEPAMVARRDGQHSIVQPGCTAHKPARCACKNLSRRSSGRWLGIRLTARARLLTSARRFQQVGRHYGLRTKKYEERKRNRREGTGGKRERRNSTGRWHCRFKPSQSVTNGQNEHTAAFDLKRKFGMKWSVVMPVYDEGDTRVSFSNKVYSRPFAFDISE
jgi:hypothetical protein